MRHCQAARERPSRVSWYRVSRAEVQRDHVLECESRRDGGACLRDGSPAPAPAGFSSIGSALGTDGVAELGGHVQPFLAAEVDDPRVQFASRLLTRSPDSRYGLFADPQPRALWTAGGLQPDTAVLPGVPVQLAVNRSAGARAARVTLQAPVGQQQPVMWRMSSRLVAPSHRVGCPMARVGRSCSVHRIAERARAGPGRGCCPQPDRVCRHRFRLRRTFAAASGGAMATGCATWSRSKS